MMPPPPITDGSNKPMSNRVNGKMITDNSDIREMWAEHFEKLGTPSTNTNFDSVFLDRVSASVQEFVTSCKNDPFGDLNDPLMYQSIPSLTIPPGNFLMGEYPTPRARKKSKASTPWAYKNELKPHPRGAFFSIIHSKNMKK